MEKAYWTHEVSERLGIGDSTLRKWCIELEKNGYTFIKGAKGSRAFTDHDVLALNYLKMLSRDKNHSLEQAAKAVTEKFVRNEVNEGTTPVTMEDTRSFPAIEVIEKLLEKFNEKISEQERVNEILLKRTETQEKFNKVLLERLEQQEKYIKEKIEQRDKLLLESIRASQEEAAAKQKQKKKIGNRIKRLFGF